MLTLTTLIFESDILLTLSPGKLNNCHKIDVLNLSQQYLCGYVIFYVSLRGIVLLSKEEVPIQQMMSE